MLGLGVSSAGSSSPLRLPARSCRRPAASARLFARSSSFSRASAWREEWAASALAFLPVRADVSSSDSGSWEYFLVAAVVGTDSEVVRWRLMDALLLYHSVSPALLGCINLGSDWLTLHFPLAHACHSSFRLGRARACSLLSLGEIALLRRRVLCFALCRVCGRCPWPRHLHVMLRVLVKLCRRVWSSSRLCGLICRGQVGRGSSVVCSHGF